MKNSFVRAMPVSYTHLDVYKRQTVCCSYRVPLAMLCLDKIRQANARQFFPDAVDIDAQSIVIHI